MRDDESRVDEPEAEDHGFHHLNPWGYTRGEWREIVKKDRRLMRHWSCLLLLLLAGWVVILWAFGVFSFLL